MNISQFKTTLSKLRNTNSRNEKQKIIAEVSDSPAAISFLSGSEFDSAGLGKKTVLGVAQGVFGEDVDGTPTVSESLEQFDADDEPSRSMEQAREDMEMLADSSGNEMKEILGSLFKGYSHPSVLAHACLNDWPTGVGDSTIADAMGVKDSLPFYDGVHEIAAAEDRLTSPVVGRPFKPMLAKSESSLPDDLSDMWAQPKLDGYRIIIHISEDSVKAFSRRMNDVTESLPELQEVDWPQGEWVFDAEVIAEDDTYKSTSERVGRKAENVERDVDMKFGLFDVIVFDSKPVDHLPYKTRDEMLHKAAGLSKGVEASTHFAGDAKAFNLIAHDDISREQARVIGSNYEGLIWKDPDAEYKFDNRSKAWVKEKNTAETVDVVAVGFDEGEGRLDGTLGRVELESADGEPVGFTGSGFSDAQRDEVWQNRDEYLGETLEVEAEAFDDGLRFPIFQHWRIDDGEPDGIERIKSVLPKP